MAYKNILYEPVPEDKRIVRLILNRADRMNALSTDLLEELRSALIQAERDSEVKVLIIKGAGRTFSAGYDLSSEAAASYVTKRDTGLDLVISRKDHIFHHHQGTWFTIWNLVKPVIAQVHGYALAGASELAFMCDLTIMAEDAITGYPPVRNFGVPDTVYHPWICGLKMAKYLTFTGNPITGAEAARIGMATMAVPGDKLEEETMKVAKKIVEVPMELLMLHKAAINKSFEIMGFRTAIETVAFLHDYAQTFDATREFFRMRDKEGLDAALKWRDSKFGDDYRALAAQLRERKPK